MRSRITYAHSIIGWLYPARGTFQPVEHTPNQKQLDQTVKDMGL
jgi:hypothetical protein